MQNFTFKIEDPKAGLAIWDQHNELAFEYHKKIKKGLEVNKCCGSTFNYMIVCL